MSVNFASYQIALSGLFTNERGLDVTGQNITNVNTPGYVRQQAMIEDAPYQTIYTNSGVAQVGLGSDIEQIRQIRNTFLDNVYRQENTSLGYWQAKDKTFSDVQAVLGDPMNSGLQDTMNQFWDSWQELSKQPDSLTIRALVAQRGENLVDQINQTGSQLDQMQSDLNSEIGVRINDINDITKQIADLNVKILKAETAGDTANDYRDQRNLLVDKLSNLVDINVNEMQDGQYDITVGGYFLVQKGNHTDLYAGKTVQSGQFTVPMLAGTNIEVPINNGELKGLMEARGEVCGKEGSTSNGSPIDKIDLVFAINRDADAAQKANIAASAAKLVDDYKAKGIDVRLGYVEFDGNGTYSYDQGTGTYNTQPEFTSDINDFTDIVENHMGASGGTSPKGLEALQSIEDMPFRDGALKQIVLATNSGVDTSTYSVDDISEQLSSAGIGVNVIGNTGAAVESQLEPLTQASGGSYYDIDSASYDAAESGLYTQMKDAIYNNVSNTQNIISDVKNQLNLLVSIMARELNSLHKTGTTLNGQPGQDFFVPINSSYPMEMGNIKLNDNLTDVNNIVASGTGKSGDNSVALEIANMRNAQLVGATGAETTLDDFYRSIISYVGNNGSNATTISGNQQKLVDSADTSRQSVSAVSMDEEMTKMIKYKFGYDAATRIVNVIDTMLDTVISRTGLAGR